LAGAIGPWVLFGKLFIYLPKDSLMNDDKPPHYLMGDIKKHDKIETDKPP
jgi:hypothetical protein